MRDGRCDCRYGRAVLLVRLLCLILVFLSFLAGCQSAPTKGTGDPPPDWVTGKPRMDDMICAVGMSEPTFYKNEAQEYAAENARKQLALTLSVEIRNIMVDISTERGSTVDEATVTEVSSWASTSVIEGSKIMGYWYDGAGVVARRPGMSFVLCCIPKKLDRESLASSISGSSGTRSAGYQEAGMTADEIINKLMEK